MTDYPEQDYTDEEEYQDNFAEEQREMYDESGGNYPIAKKPESLFSLFKDVWRTRDSSKVGNLDKEELGSLGVSVRDCQRISLLSNTLHHSNFGKYWRAQGEITLATSMSRKGWFVELFVTSKKFAHKGLVGGNNQVQQSKWRLFGKENKTTEPQ